MKLISCHIENFGKLNNRDYNFNAGINMFSEENGAGKTTLADFIKAMFYGLPAYKSNTKTFGGRQRYYPFNGGKFGGNLTFEKGGETYRIERFFDRKSDVKDETRVYKNGAQIKMSENFGREIFGLDEESFSRTAFITAQDIDGGSDSDICEKIAGRVFDAGSAGLEEALLALEKKRKGLKAARGGGGAIDLNKAKRSEVLSRIADLQNTDAALGELYNKRKVLAEEISSLEKTLEKLNEQRLIAEKRATYDRLKKELDEKRAELDGIKAAYPCGVPEREDIEKAEEYYSEYDKKSGALSNTEFTGEEKLALLEEKFKEGVPADGELDGYAEILETSKRLEVEAEQLEKSGLSANEERLQGVFRHGLPDDELVKSVEKSSENYVENERLFKSQTVAAGKKINRAPFIISAAAAAAVLAAGVILIFFVTVAGIVLTALGGAALIAAGLAYFFVKTKNPAESSAGVIAEMRRSEEEIRSRLTPYGYYSDSVLADKAAFLKDVADYKIFLEESKNKTSAAAEKRENSLKGYEKISLFLNKYGYAKENLREGLDGLRGDVSEYRLLSAQREAFDTNRRNLDKERGEALDKVAEILQKYGLEVGDGEGLRKISDDVKNFARLEKEEAQRAAAYEKYGKENDLKEGAAECGEDYDGVKAELDKKIKERGLLDGNIAECEINLENLPAKIAEKERLDGLIERDTRAVKILSAAEELLKQANARLLDKYTKPVKDSFLRYLDTIQKPLGLQIGVSPDFQLNAEFGGEIKSRLHFSAGQLAVCGLCFRFALIENIFKDEKPFVVMDDPFVNLDKNNAESTLKAVKTFGGNVQIIYFCCHDSREIH